MSQYVKIGTIARSDFDLYEVDGTTRRAGAVADVETRLTFGGGASALVVTVAEIEDVGYQSTFVPDAAGVYTLVSRDTVHGVDYTETFQAGNYDVDDVAFAVADVDVDVAEVAGAVADVAAGVAALTLHDALMSVTGVDALRAGAEWSPTLVFLRRSTMTPIDLDVIEDLPVFTGTLLAGDGTTEVAEITAEDLTRTALGNYSTTLDALDVAGTYFIRAVFQIDDTSRTDIVRISAAPALGAGAAAANASAPLDRCYTCPTFLTQARHDLTEMTTEDVWRRIQDVSAQIEALTNGNIFVAERAVYECSGRQRRLVYHPMQLPFVHVETVAISEDRTDLRRDSLFRASLGVSDIEALLPEQWVLRAGMIEAVRLNFPSGPGNVFVTGAIGTIEGPMYVTAETTSAIGSASTFVTLDSVTGFRPRMVVDVVADSGACRLIVTAVDASASRLHFDALGGEFDAVPAGATVRAYGAVPRNVTLVANYLFGQAVREEAAQADGGDEFVPASRIKRERTDNYEIEFNVGTGNSLTGNPKYDRLLAPYVRDLDVRFP